MNTPELEFHREKRRGSKNQTLSINKSKRIIKARFRVYTLMDGDYCVTYVPSLNVSGYGSDQTEADEMLKETLNDYFVTLLDSKQSVIDMELKKYGWTKSLFKKQFHNSTYVDKNGILQNFNLPENTQITESSVLVA